MRIYTKFEILLVCLNKFTSDKFAFKYWKV